MQYKLRLRPLFKDSILLTHRGILFVSVADHISGAKSFVLNYLRNCLKFLIFLYSSNAARQHEPVQAVQAEAPPAFQRLAFSNAPRLRASNAQLTLTCPTLLIAFRYLRHCCLCKCVSETSVGQRRVITPTHTPLSSGTVTFQSRRGSGHSSSHPSACVDACIPGYAGTPVVFVPRMV